MLKENHGVRIAYGGLQHSFGIIRVRWDNDSQSGDMSIKGLDTLRVIESAVDTAAIWHTYHEWHVEIVVRTEAYLRRLVHYLVHGRVAEVGELHLRDWPHTVERCPDSCPRNERLGKGGIKH